MLTGVGKFLRKLRIDNGEILKTMAETLGVSSAFLSAVENGKKKMPESWYGKLSAAYSFSEAQQESLRTAVMESNDRVEIHLQHASAGNRELAILFARQFDALDDETGQKIAEMLKKYKGN